MKPARCQAEVLNVLLCHVVVVIIIIIIIIISSSSSSSSNKIINNKSVAYSSQGSTPVN